MEEKIFRLPAVAAELGQYIEARLHTDGGPRVAENLELQRELARTVALPTFVVVDPASGERLRAKSGLMKADTFAGFLRGESAKAP